MTLQERLVGLFFRGPGFDQIRLAAATVVLLHHCRSVAHIEVRDDALFHYSGGFIQFGFLAVAVFFAISGFLVTPGLARSGNVIDFTVNRVLRIFPGLILVVFSTIMVLGSALTTYSPAAYFSDPMLYRYAKNVLTLTNNFLPGVIVDNRPIVVNGALWTLHFEILSYAALALLSTLGLLRRRGLFLMLFVASYCTYVAMSIEPNFASILPDRFATFIGLYVYFAAGSTLYLFSDRIPFSMGLAFVAFLSIMVTLPIGLGPLFMPLCLPYTVVFLGLSDLPGKSFLKKDLSYGVYLIHAAILTGFRVLFPEFRIWWLAALIIFGITLMLSYLSWTFVEGPALKLKRAVSDWLNARLGLFLPSRAALLTNKGER